MASFADEVIAELAKPLARAAVKQREQGRGKVSYIEGWHAIAEANRIFGFDGWTRETVMSECCHAGEYEKAVWENGRRTNKTIASFRCTYRARVRVTAGGIMREGSGHGHGFADNPGEAHESAEKEAETDAMKRALMTFGNPFGLALYDKAQAEVEPIGRPAQAQRRAVERDDPFGDEPPAMDGTARPALTARDLPPHPEETPPSDAERAALSAWWTRDNYGVDPEVITGGIGRWDAEMLRLIAVAPSLDAFHKLREDNAEHFAAWAGRVSPAVAESFNRSARAAYRRLAEVEGVAA